jgi:hypothetical protein
MICFMHEGNLQRLYASDARINADRKMNGIQEFAASCGVHLINGGNQGGIGWVVARLDPAKRGTWFQFLSDPLVAALTVESEDARVLLPGLDGLVLQRYLEENPQALARLRADEVMDSAMQLSYSLQTAEAQEAGWDTDIAKRDLVHHGLLTQEEADREPLAPRAEPDPQTNYDKYDGSEDGEFDPFARPFDGGLIG